MNSGVHWSGSRNDGGGLVGIIKMARIGWMSPYGGLPSAISSAVMPEIEAEPIRGSSIKSSQQQPKKKNKKILVHERLTFLGPFNNIIFVFNGQKNFNVRMIDDEIKKDSLI